MKPRPCHTTKSCVCMNYFFYYFLYFLRCVLSYTTYFFNKKYGSLPLPKTEKGNKDTLLAPSIIISYFLTIVIFVNIFWIHSGVTYSAGIILWTTPPNCNTQMQMTNKNLLLYVLLRLWRLLFVRFKKVDIFWLSKVPNLIHIIVTFFKEPHVQIHPLMVIMIRHIVLPI